MIKNIWQGEYLQNKMEKQPSYNNEAIIKILNKVCNHFKDGLFENAIELLERALKIDYEYNGVTSALKYATFWKERKERLLSIAESYEKAEFLMDQWELFSKFLYQIGETSERCLYNLKQYVFGAALKNYHKLKEASGLYDIDVLVKIGRCYKAVGNFDKAIEYLVIANQQKSCSPEILAQLADCYSLINEVRISKAFFREAFFLGPKEISLVSLDSGMIHKLIKEIKKTGVPDDLLAYWIPVYGTIFGVFTIKRELRPLEFGKLKQAIYSLEKKLGEKNEIQAGLVPTLINHYFWLIDHYISAREDKSKIEEVLLKIKDIDLRIYNEYIQ